MTAPQPRVLHDVEFLAINLVPDPDGRLRAWTTIRDRDTGTVHTIPGGLLTAPE